MSHSKLQRWTDLIAALLARRLGATFLDLARDVPAYAPGIVLSQRDSMKRTFERDKDELRDFGIPIETLDADDENETRYRLRPNAFYLPFLALPEEGPEPSGTHVPPEGYRTLPAVTLTPDDVDILGEAVARLAQLGDRTLADDAFAAANKLAFELPLFDAGHTDVRLLDVGHGADAKTFDLLGDALRRRKIVTFSYEKPSGGFVAKREVESWGLFFVNAHWYLAARDRDGMPAHRRAERAAEDLPASHHALSTPGRERSLKNFRISRMRDVSMNRKKPRAPDYEIPAEFRLREHAQSREPWELGDGQSVVAEVRFTGTSGAAAAAARAGEAVPGDDQLRRYPVRRMDTFMRWLLSFAGDAQPVAPAELVELYRTTVRETLLLYGRGA